MATILFVDEDVGLLQSHFDYIEAIGGHQVVCAGGPREAVTLMQKLGETIDLVVLDLMLPVDNMYDRGEVSLGLTTGVRFLETVREKLPGTPVVVYTGIASDAVKHRVLDLGVSEEDYLEKPIGAGTLLDRLNHVLEG